MGLTIHGLQSDQTGDKVVKVDSHVSLCVAQDDQLKQVVVQLETWVWRDERENQMRKEEVLQNSNQKVLEKVFKSTREQRKSELAPDFCWGFSNFILVLKWKETAPADPRAILIS